MVVVVVVFFFLEPRLQPSKCIFDSDQKLKKYINETNRKLWPTTIR